ncbi:hypothetical protein CAOG_02224 [Capsaspora owczarzaki ATCC 30864]|uniref:Uncharacterized protein n=1 Tax=Capsaspora owczarzaki (strain ATCC 30864) TaxID=595528 RepID=A0A0D2WKW0_CAPO3|nr:hypothetical protein CAOG_02224 [Capsaspora owczarzaki ATCC 30864]KJE91020.1 hypothetical protein CAOG_002224 [Capsaspora owczarzaki ATCC 30864]|eukprot:XP_004348974.1 hypothetical protein CAOG_02224 [Capsaspora owczarzaki ATCC 30864]
MKFSIVGAPGSESEHAVLQLNEALQRCMDPSPSQVAATLAYSVHLDDAGRRLGMLELGDRAGERTGSASVLSSDPAPHLRYQGKQEFDKVQLKYNSNANSALAAISDGTCDVAVVHIESVAKPALDTIDAIAAHTNLRILCTFCPTVSFVLARIPGGNPNSDSNLVVCSEQADESLKDWLSTVFLGPVMQDRVYTLDEVAPHAQALQNSSPRESYAINCVVSHRTAAVMGLSIICHVPTTISNAWVKSQFAMVTSNPGPETSHEAGRRQSLLRLTTQRLCPAGCETVSAYSFVLPNKSGALLRATQVFNLRNLTVGAVHSRSIRSANPNVKPDVGHTTWIECSRVPVQKHQAILDDLADVAKAVQWHGAFPASIKLPIPFFQDQCYMCRNVFQDIQLMSDSQPSLAPLVVSAASVEPNDSSNLPMNILDLPFEVMELILMHVAAPLRDYSLVHPHFRPSSAAACAVRVMVVAKVCKRWRHVLHRCSSLWRQLCLAREREMVSQRILTSSFVSYETSLQHWKPFRLTESCTAATSAAQLGEEPLSKWYLAFMHWSRTLQNWESGTHSIKYFPAPQLAEICQGPRIDAYVALADGRLVCIVRPQQHQYLSEQCALVVLTLCTRDQDDGHEMACEERPFWHVQRVPLSLNLPKVTRLFSDGLRVICANLDQAECFDFRNASTPRSIRTIEVASIASVAFLSETRVVVAGEEAVYSVALDSQAPPVLISDMAGVIVIGQPVVSTRSSLRRASSSQPVPLIAFQRQPGTTLAISDQTDCQWTFDPLNHYVVFKPLNANGEDHLPFALNVPFQRYFEDGEDSATGVVGSHALLYTRSPITAKQVHSQCDTWQLRLPGKDHIVVPYQGSQLLAIPRSPTLASSGAALVNFAPQD